MHRHSPLMRSLFSQFQTPTAPRRAVGFFRSGCPSGCPAWLITQSTSGQQFYSPSLSTVDGSNLNRAFKNVNANYWKTDAYKFEKSIRPAFAQKVAQR